QKQEELIIGSIKDLLKTWDTHGKELSADVLFFERQLLIIFLNDESISASGCAVDSLNREVISIINAENRKLADRNKIPLYYQNKIDLVDRMSIKDLYDQGHVTDEYSLINITLPFERSKGFNQFLLPIKESWLKEYL